MHIKTILITLALAALVATGTASAADGRWPALLERIGLIEQANVEQDERLAALEQALDETQTDLAEARRAAAELAWWVHDDAEARDYRLRRCGAKATQAKQRVCFFRLF